MSLSPSTTGQLSLPLVFWSPLHQPWAEAGRGTGSAWAQGRPGHLQGSGGWRGQSHLPPALALAAAAAHPCQLTWLFPELCDLALNCPALGFQGKCKLRAGAAPPARARPTSACHGFLRPLVVRLQGRAVFTSLGEEALSPSAHCCAPEPVQEQQATPCVHIP